MKSLDFIGHVRVFPRPVRVKTSLTVLAAAALAACATPAREPPPLAASVASASGTAPATSAVPPSPSPPPAPTATEAPDSPESSATGSAYVGCGEPIPLERLWDETSEAQVLEAISAAKRCAAEHERRLLLEFVAPWCQDCREMAKLDATETVDKVLRERFERVRINVGKWDRHEALRNNYGVKALATYIVIDPKTSRVLVQTTLEPITKKRGKRLTAADWATWLQAH